jgi:fatty acyl-CoA reductase
VRNSNNSQVSLARLFRTSLRCGLQNQTHGVALFGMCSLLVAAPCPRQSSARTALRGPRLQSRVRANGCAVPQLRATTTDGEEEEGGTGGSASTSVGGFAPSPPSPAHAVGCNKKQSVHSFLHDRTLVLTGSTGFLAKVFLEKLLWEQPDVRKIFLIITPRAGKSAAARLREQIIDTPLFDRLRKRHGDGFQAFVDERLVPVAGDLGAEGLGLSSEDETSIVAEAEVIVNSAATTTFNERFDIAVNVNTLGPRRLLRLSRKCPNVMLMCHVSTAFANGLRRGHASERAFNTGDCIAQELSPTGEGPVLNPYAEVELALAAGRAAAGKVRSDLQVTATSECIDDGSERDGATCDAANGKNAANGGAGVRNGGAKREPLIIPHLDPVAEAELVQLGSERARFYGWQDTYVFTKAMGEQMLAAERGDVPLAIIRPSIVEGALQEPFPGWIEGVRMADPLILAYGKGLIRGFVGDSTGVLDLVPVDAVVSVMLASLPETAAMKKTFVRGGRDESRVRSIRGEVAGNDSLDRPDGDFIGGNARRADGDGVVVYHVATSTLNPLNFAEFMRIVSRHFRSAPLIDRRSGKPIVADTKIKVFSSRFMFELDTWLRQGGAVATTDLLREAIAPGTIPSADKRRRAGTRRTLEQLRTMGSLYAPYTSYEARFQSDNVKALRASLSAEERKAFPFELEKLDWEEYLSTVHIPGLLKHALRVKA